DDEARRALHLLVAKRGFEVAAAGDLATAQKHLASSPCDVVLAAAELAPEACALPDAPAVIAVVRTRDLALAMSLLEAGVHDVITEPIDDLAVALALRHVPRKTRANGNGHGAHGFLPTPEIVGDGAAMQKLKQTIRVVAPTR